MQTLKSIILTSLASLTIIISFADAQSESIHFELNDSSVIWIDGTSNFHDWSIISNAASGSFDGEIPPTESLMPELGKPITLIDQFPLGTLIVPVRSIVSGHVIMDRIMRKSLRAREHPEIKFRFLGTKEIRSSVADSSWQLIALGTMEIGGVQREFEFPADVSLVDNRQLSISGSRTMRMTDFQIEPPTALAGMLKTGDKIVLHLELHASTGVRLNAVVGSNTEVRGTR